MLSKGFMIRPFQGCEEFWKDALEKNENETTRQA